MTRSTEPITAYELSNDPRLSDWRPLLGVLHARFETGSFGAGAALAAAIAQVADELDHHPDLDLRYRHLTVRTVSHDVGHVSSRDVDLAVRVSELAAAAGHLAVPDSLSVLEIALDVVDMPACRGFWAAVLGYAEGQDDVVDTHASLPSLWFQDMDPPRTERGRFHLDLTLPPDVVQSRMAAALGAGGRLVSDEAAPSFWVLADPEGNEVCLCTWQGRAGSGEGPATDATAG
ncbi:MAG: VOC family protein [Ornithinimicrobium sp.]|uniref:VOC family protein n=1 Tax=Ornithinimicrobium sp. TaxID=1977084 RepID=UPI003D9B6540